MSNAEHLIENALEAIRRGTEFDEFKASRACTDNAAHTSATASRSTALTAAHP